MAQATLKLDTRRALKDGTYPIVIAIGYGRKLNIPMRISARREDFTAGHFSGRGAKAIDSMLQTKLAAVTVRLAELRESGHFDRLDNQQLRALLEDTDAPVPVSADKKRHLGDVWQSVMGAKSGRTREIYASTLVKLKQHCDPDNVRFDDIDRLWLDSFVASMSDLSPNTRSLHMRNLRAVCNYAVDMGVTDRYPFRRYQMPKQTSRSRAFAANVIANLAALPLGHNAVYRDIFMLTFYLVGINFVDLCNLTGIVDGRIEYVRAKTHKKYSIKVEPEAMAIIERYRGTAHLLPMLDTHKHYLSYYRQLRRGLEAVRSAYNSAHPDAPIDELTTYWARHSWATIAAELDIPKETIAAALGHEIGNPTTAIYIDYNKAKVDDANRRVIDHVLGLG